MFRFSTVSSESNEAIDKLLEQSKEDENWGGGSCEDSLDDDFYDRDDADENEREYCD